MNSFKDKMARFMYGRYGMDQLSRNLSLICLILLIITMFARNNVIYTTDWYYIYIFQGVFA